jgi:hypothetical protein
MTFNSKSLVLSKLSVILSSTLAHHNNSGSLQQLWEEGGPSPDNSTSSSCNDPCADLNAAIQSEILTIIPSGIALACSLLAILPTLVLKSKHKVLGIKSYLWVLLQLWVFLLITHFLYTQRKDKAQAYVWALHSSTHVLASWAPKKGAVKNATLHYIVTTLGAACVGLFAWQFGPSVGLAAWYSKRDALCGWSVHLVAVLGVELTQWMLSPLEALIVGL